MQVADSPSNLHHRWGKIDRAIRGLEADVDISLNHNTTKLSQEIRMKIDPAIFSISDSLQTQIFLKFDNIADSSAFNLK
jgi:hypothetical protein